MIFSSKFVPVPVSEIWRAEPSTPLVPLVSRFELMIQLHWLHQLHRFHRFNGSAWLGSAWTFKPIWFGLAWFDFLSAWLGLSFKPDQAEPLTTLSKRNESIYGCNQLTYAIISQRCYWSCHSFNPNSFGLAVQKFGVNCKLISSTSFL